ncbi:MAG: sugar transferase, partial [Tepidisphaeraceae bacterium]
MNLAENPFSTSLHRQPATQIRCLRALCSPEEIQTALQLERSRADRSGGIVSGVIFEAGDDPHAEHNKHSRTLQVAALVLRASRDTDAIGTLSRGQERICALLSDTAVAGADCFVDRVRTLALGWGIEVSATVYCYPTDESNHDTHGGTNRPVGEQRCRPLRHMHPTRGPSLALNRQSMTVDPTHLQTSPITIDLHNLPTISQPSGDPIQHGVKQARVTASLPLAHLRKYRMPLWKRLFDIVGAIVGLILFSPVMVISAAMIRLSTRGPVIFTQRRTGWRGREFTIYKFRTMTT